MYQIIQTNSAQNESLSQSTETHTLRIERQGQEPQYVGTRRGVYLDNATDRFVIIDQPAAY